MIIFYFFKNDPEPSVPLIQGATVIASYYGDSDEEHLEQLVSSQEFVDATEGGDTPVLVVFLFEGENLTEENIKVLRNIESASTVHGAKAATDVGVEVRALKMVDASSATRENMVLGTLPDPIGHITDGKVGLALRRVMDMTERQYGQASGASERLSLCLQLAELNRTAFTITGDGEYRFIAVRREEESLQLARTSAPSPESAYALLVRGDDVMLTATERISHYHESLQLWPMQAVAHYRLALLMKQLGKWDAVMGYAAAAAGVGPLTRAMPAGVLRDVVADWDGPFDLMIEAGTELYSPLSPIVRGLIDGRTKLLSQLQRT